MTNSGAILVPFRRNQVIPVPFRWNPVIPVDSGAIPVELPDSGRNLWGTIKYWTSTTKRYFWTSKLMHFIPRPHVAMIYSAG